MKTDQTTRPSATGHAEPAQERLNLISSDRVRGTRVFGLRSEHIGEIDSFVIDKPSGRIVYAMMSFGGFLGFGEDIYPIPWSKLSYDTELAGYKTDLTQEMVQGASETRVSDQAMIDDPLWNQRVHSYYGTAGFWM